MVQQDDNNSDGGQVTQLLKFTRTIFLVITTITAGIIFLNF